MKMQTLVAGVASLFMVASAAQATTYTGVRPIPGATVDLSITTDSATGPLSGSDITSWNISVTDNAGSVDFTPDNSEVLFIGTVGGLSATPTALSFDFSSASLLLFEQATIGDGGPFYCANGQSNCYTGHIVGEGVSTQYGESPIEQVAQTGEVVLATAGGVPEPAVWTMMLVGFGALGASLRSRRQRMSARIPT